MRIHDWGKVLRLTAYGDLVEIKKPAENRLFDELRKLVVTHTQLLNDELPHGRIAVSVFL